jgi:acyl-CoA reductase-like NAD-dependent aldehyde dehydrogenase
MSEDQPDRDTDQREPKPEATGHPEVDAALAALDELARHPFQERLAILEAVHDSLRQVLVGVGEDRPVG